MAKLAFTFSYQAFTRYVATNCDSEQEVRDTNSINEAWLYENIREYLRGYGNDIYDYTQETFRPAEFRAERGHPRVIDFAGHSKSSGKLRVLLEAKLMVDDARDWPDEILTDIVRVASVREQTTSRTRRHVLVVGQKRVWEQALRCRGGVLADVCPLEPDRSPGAPPLAKRKRTVRLTDELLETAGVRDDYLVGIRPAAVKIALIGYYRVQRGDHDQPAAAMTARLWRVFPVS